jgi:hypothetical protein
MLKIVKWQMSKLRKYKYKQYRQSLIDKLDSLLEENPKLYWNIVNELQGKSEKSDSCAVPSPTLVSHFKTLFKYFTNCTSYGYSPVIIWIRWIIAFMYCCYVSICPRVWINSGS